MYMEHPAAWGVPLEFQWAAMNWTTEEEPTGDAQAWAAPAAGNPLEYASIVDIFGSSCSLQPYVDPASSSSGGGSSGGQQQLVEYNYYNYYAATAQHDEKATAQEDEEQMETYVNNPKKLFQERNNEFKGDAKLMKKKMHRYPPNIRALDTGGLYTVPKVVAIGPYHHYGADHIKEAEKVKHVAAFNCMEQSGLDVQELYQEVVLATEKIKACDLYDKDVMAGIGYEDEFLPMMFYDACFLVMYMLRKKCEKELSDFFKSNDDDIAHDIMLLENQIPWLVVDAVMNKCTPNPLEKMKKFIKRCKDGFLLDRRSGSSGLALDWDEGYYNKAPHLLALVRFYIAGKRKGEPKVPKSDLKKIKSIQISASAIELAEMGIFLTANETIIDELPADMGLKRKWIIFAELPIVPLSLNDLRASMLINMAALELCTTPYFWDVKKARREESAVCSYLLLLSMLVHREEDVHQLRTKGILKGAGLSNNETLGFFTSLQGLRIGRSYGHVMEEIENYKMKRWRWWLWLYKFLYKNWKIIVGIVSAVSAFASILATLVKLKGAH